MSSALDIVLHSGFQVATYPAGATFGPRVLPDWEFVYLIEGDAEYRWNERTVAAPQGSIVLCRPEATDFFRWDTRRRTRHGWFHFGLDGDIPDDWPPTAEWPLARTPASESELLPTLFREMLAKGPDSGAKPTPTAMRLFALSVLAAFVTEGTAHSARGVDSRQYPDPVTRAMAFIAERLEERPADALPLGEIAQAACVTPEHLCRLFKASTGHSPSETVRLARLDRAAVLLARTNYTVGEIARLCGFESPFHFARRFKEAFGQTPSDVRRSVAEGGVVPITRLLRLHHSK